MEKKIGDSIDIYSQNERISATIICIGDKKYCMNVVDTFNVEMDISIDSPEPKKVTLNNSKFKF